MINIYQSANSPTIYPVWLWRLTGTPAGGSANFAICGGSAQNYALNAILTSDSSPLGCSPAHELVVNFTNPGEYIFTLEQNSSTQCVANSVAKVQIIEATIANDPAQCDFTMELVNPDNLNDPCTCKNITANGDAIRTYAYRRILTSSDPQCVDTLPPGDDNVYKTVSETSAFLRSGVKSSQSVTIQNGGRITQVTMYNNQLPNTPIVLDTSGMNAYAGDMATFRSSFLNTLTTQLTAAGFSNGVDYSNLEFLYINTNFNTWAISSDAKHLVNSPSTKWIGFKIYNSTVEIDRNGTGDYYYLADNYWAVGAFSGTETYNLQPCNYNMSIFFSGGQPDNNPDYEFDWNDLIYGNVYPSFFICSPSSVTETCATGRLLTAGASCPPHTPGITNYSWTPGGPSGPTEDYKIVANGSGTHTVAVTSSAGGMSNAPVTCSKSVTV